MRTIGRWVGDQRWDRPRLSRCDRYLLVGIQSWGSSVQEPVSSSLAQLQTDLSCWGGESQLGPWTGWDPVGGTGRSSGWAEYPDPCTERRQLQSERKPPPEYLLVLSSQAASGSPACYWPSRGMSRLQSASLIGWSLPLSLPIIEGQCRRSLSLPISHHTPHCFLMGCLQLFTNTH